MSDYGKQPHLDFLLILITVWGGTFEGSKVWRNAKIMNMKHERALSHLSPVCTYTFTDDERPYYLDLLKYQLI